MKWINSVPSPVCENCNHSFSKSSNEIQCSEYHETFQEQQHIDDKSTLFAQSNNTKSGEDKQKVNEMFDEHEQFPVDDTNSNIDDAMTDEVLSDEKRKQRKIEVEKDSTKRRKMFLFPYYDEIDKYYEKDKNYTLAVGDKRKFTRSKKTTFRNHVLENPNDRKNSLLDALKECPYNETNVTSIKRLNEEQIEEMHRSILNDQDELKIKATESTSHILDEMKPTTYLDISKRTLKDTVENKDSIDMSRHATDEVMPTSINIVYEEPESDEDAPVPHGQSINDYTYEFMSQQSAASGHAFVQPENPSDTFFNEYDPLSHGDVLNFLACKNAKKKTAKPDNTKTMTKTKTKGKQKRQQKKQNAKERESHA